MDNCGLRIVDCGIDWEASVRGACFDPGASWGNPQSAIHNPQL